MSQRRKALVMLGVMCTTAGVGWALKPGERTRKDKQDFVLEQLVPESFGSWRLIPAAVTTVNPQAQELLDKLYSQILERTYVDQDGYPIMLAIAYGADQRGTLEAHKPEICYPAQGFKVRRNEAAQLDTLYGNIPVRRLDTVSAQREEPVTYWFTVANNTVQSKVDKRLLEIRLALTGQVPDGMLFRVSSIDTDPAQAWAKQAAFVNALLAAIPASSRAKLAGLKA